MIFGATMLVACAGEPQPRSATTTAPLEETAPLPKKVTPTNEDVKTPVVEEVVAEVPVVEPQSAPPAADLPQDSRPCRAVRIEEEDDFKTNTKYTKTTTTDYTWSKTGLKKLRIETKDSKYGDSWQDFRIKKGKDGLPKSIRSRGEAHKPDGKLAAKAEYLWEWEWTKGKLSKFRFTHLGTSKRVAELVLTWPKDAKTTPTYPHIFEWMTWTDRIKPREEVYSLFSGGGSGPVSGKTSMCRHYRGEKPECKESTLDLVYDEHGRLISVTTPKEVAEIINGAYGPLQMRKERKKPSYTDIETTIWDYSPNGLLGEIREQSHTIRDGDKSGGREADYRWERDDSGKLLKKWRTFYHLGKPGRPNMSHEFHYECSKE